MASKNAPRIPYRRPRVDQVQLVERAKRFFELMNGRRSVRSFSSDPVPREAVEYAIAAASTAPSGANKQPWTFVLIDDASLKREIRLAAEEQEQHFYAELVTPQFLADLAPFDTSWQKPFLEQAPYLIAVFRQLYQRRDDGSRGKHYYTTESVGIAVGLLIAALTKMGLCTLPYTPSPMSFLARLLNRPTNERAYMLLPVGYPADDATVPDIGRKPPSEVVVINRPDDGEI
jgi:nitroreductase